MLNNFLFFLAGVLTTLVFSLILSLWIRLKSKTSLVLSQSQVYQIAKFFMPDDEKEIRKTQSQILYDEKPVRFVHTADNKVYWLEENVLYWAPVGSRGDVDLLEKQQVDLADLSEKRVKELIEILDAIQNG